MRPSSRAFGISLILGITLLLAAGTAQAQLTGSGSLAGLEKFKVGPGCGPTQKAPVGISFSVDGGTTFSASIGGNTYTGALIGNAKETKFNLVFDTSSTLLLIDVLANFASFLCGTDIIVTAAEIRKAKAKINKKRTKTKLRIKFRGAGVGEVTGKAKYSLKAKGNFFPN